jgi:ClpP class serine protease
LADDKIKSILLDINSPGGSTDLIPEMAVADPAGAPREAGRRDGEHDAASAAYWLGSQASEFVVTPSGKVGSIGVFARTRTCRG